jgi:hypothetical protein
MNKSTLSKEQLSSLSQEQQQVISDYYHLVANALSTPPDADDVIRAWEIAGTDLEIRTWLECIDFFCMASDGNDQFNEDTRAYLSEYIVPIALQKHPQDSEMSKILETKSSLHQNHPDQGLGCIPDLHSNLNPIHQNSCDY